jgi:translation initiation factor 1
MSDIARIITIDDKDCMDDYPCRHSVVVESDLGQKTLKMKADEIFYLCCKNDYPVPAHIKDGFRLWVAEKQIVHIRIIQMGGRKKVTICQGLLPETNLTRVLRSMQKNFNAGGAIIESQEFGRVVQLQGNHALNMKTLLVETGLCSAENVHIHGL